MADTNFAADTATAPSTAEAAKAPALATSAAPELPPYFSGANADKNKPSWPDPTGSAAGAGATPANDAKGDIPSKLTTSDLYDRIAHNLFSINMVWALIAGFLVMFMQAGFAMVETGLCRAKNSAHTMSMNLMIYALGCIGFWAYGFAVGWGNWINGLVGPGWYSTLGPGTSVLNSGWGLGVADAATGAFKYGLIGLKGFFLNGVDDVSVMALFFFMMVFMDTTATIPTGARRSRHLNACPLGVLSPALRRDLDPAAHVHDVVPLLKLLREFPRHLVGVGIRPKPILLRHRIRVAVLRQDVIRLQGVDERHRIIDLHVVLGRREKQHVDVLQQQVILQKHRIARLEDRLAADMDHVTAIVQVGVLVHRAHPIAMDCADRFNPEALELQRLAGRATTIRLSGIASSLALSRQLLGNTNTQRDFSASTFDVGPLK